MCCIFFSRDTSLKVWSLHTLEMLHHMGGHTGVVTCVQLVPASAGMLTVLLEWFEQIIMITVILMSNCSIKVI